ncbi:hypothetical protein INR49_004127 [Caranx melampygus]|nr:hypothetical protein INR49_004127 [Caranx melampygus]
MSCLDVMYQVFGPQPYFSSYSPYHHQKLAFYSKMQDPQDGGSRLGPPGPRPSRRRTRSCRREPNGSFPMSQRSFPPSFWNSSYQPTVSSALGSALSASHTELSFPGDPYSSASLHSHLHQPSPTPGTRPTTTTTITTTLTR